MKEAISTVDLGYHYLALNAQGQPVDTDGDARPDYLEDINGNGSADGSETSWSSWDNFPSGAVNLQVYTPLR